MFPAAGTKKPVTEREDSEETSPPLAVELFKVLWIINMVYVKRNKKEYSNNYLVLRRDRILVADPVLNGFLKPYVTRELLDTKGVDRGSQCSFGSLLADSVDCPALEGGGSAFRLSRKRILDRILGSASRDI